MACHELYFKIEEIFNSRFVDVETRYCNKFRKTRTEKIISKCKLCQKKEGICEKHQEITDFDILPNGQKRFKDFKTSSSGIWYIFTIDVECRDINLPKL